VPSKQPNGIICLGAGSSFNMKSQAAPGKYSRHYGVMHSCCHIILQKVGQDLGKIIITEPDMWR
jgi:hypothetical protein